MARAQAPLGRLSAQDTPPFLDHLELPFSLALHSGNVPFVQYVALDRLMILFGSYSHVS
jgi:hypothetical protein